MSAAEGGLVGGFVGAVAGFFVGGGPAGAAIGWSLGAAAGGALGKSPGPQISVAKFNGSSYGTMLEIVMGTDRRAGTIIEVQDPNVQQASGGKGGQSSGSATETFAVALHDGPIVVVLAIWADGGLVYDARPGSTFNNDLPVTFYLGTGTQMPDPTLEAIHGVGNVPAYRHTAYVVFNAWDITKWGRIPNLNFLICESAGAIPWRVSTYSRLNTGSNFGTVSYDVAKAQTTNTFFTWSPGQTTPVAYTTAVRAIDGTLISASSMSVPTILLENLFTMSAVSNAPIWYQCTTIPHNGWFVSGVRWLVGILAGNALAVYHSAAYFNGNVYAAAESPNAVNKFSAPSGYPAIVAIASYALSSAANNFLIAVSDDGFVYVRKTDSTVFVKLDADLNLVHDWGAASTGLDITGYGFAVYGDLIVSHYVDHTGASLARVVQMNPDDTFSLIGDIPVAVGELVGLANGLISVADGVISINPPPALITYQYATDRISALAGLDGTQYNADELNQPLYGYTIDNQMPCQSAAQQLFAMDQFDSVERAGVLTFVRRGHDPVATIPDSDLGVTDAIGTPTPLLTVVRAQEEDLPQTLNITYPNIGAEYQPNTQYARIEATRSQSVVTLPVAVILDDNTALATAQTLLYNARMEREDITFTTSRKWSWLEPTDVVNCHGYTLRITDVTYGANGVITFKARPTNSGIWLASAPTGASASGFKVSTVTPKQTSDLVMLDLPLISDTDPVGFYFAMAGSSSPTWRGATLYRSTDGGVNWVPIATQTVPSTVGTVSNALGDFNGGNIVDEGNSMTVVVGPGGGTFPAFTQAAILNGAGMVSVGSEVLQYRDAALIATSTYLLSGLLRGRRGTEWAIPGHVASERIVALPATNVPGATSDLNKAWLYKAVTAGNTLGSATAVAFTWTGASLKPYSPSHVGGGPNAAGDVTINWKRRTRIGGAWIDYSDVLLGEAIEAYDVDFMDAAFINVARTVRCATPTVLYLGASQVTDFGSTQLHICGRVFQIGSFGRGQPTSFVIPSVGASDTAVLVPVRPPGSPPPSRGCTLPVIAGTLAWSANTILSPTLDPSMEWVVAVTTGAIVGGSAPGTVTMAEFGGGPIQRTGVLSNAPCGNPLTPSCSIVSNTLTWPFYMTGNPNPGYYPTLLPFTTYYFSVNTSAVGGMYAQLQLPH